MKKFLAPFVILTMMAVILCGSFCLIQASMHPHCTSMNHQEQNQVNSPEAKLDLHSQPQLLAVIDPKEIKEACGTKNIHHKQNSFSLTPTQQHAKSQQLVHHFTGSKDFI